MLTHDSRPTLHANNTAGHPKGPAFPSGPMRKAPHVAKGHDAILKNLQDRGAVINIQTISNELYVGTLVNRDRYTITIRRTIERQSTDYTIYKHAIESFSAQAAA